MKQIKNFVQQNQMTLVAVVVVVFFSVWMYTAHKNIAEREAQRQARIEQVIAAGGVHYPSQQLTVDKSYIAAE